MCKEPCSNLSLIFSNMKLAKTAFWLNDTYLNDKNTSQLVDLLDIVMYVQLGKLTRAHSVEQKSNGLNALTRIRSLFPIGSYTH